MNRGRIGGCLAPISSDSFLDASNKTPKLRHLGGLSIGPFLIDIAADD